MRFGSRWGAQLQRLWSWIKRPEVLVAIIAVVPIVSALIRAIHANVMPMGDFANLEIRSRDVFSLHHFPLLGTSSSASQVLGVGVNHPGPMLFYICAPFVTLFGGAVGLATAVAVINSSCVAGSIYVAYRIFGRSGALSAAVIASIITWTLGSDLLVAAWNPYILLFPCLLMIFLTAGVASGHGMMLPWLLLVGTFCIQTHIGYVYIVIGLCAFAVVVAGIKDLKQRSSTLMAKRIRHKWLLAVIVMLLGWLPPIWEQIFVDGNIGNLMQGLSEDVHRIGMGLAVRLVAAVIALPPFWNRSSLSDSIPPLLFDNRWKIVDDDVIPGLRSSIFGLAILLSVLIFLVIRGRLKEDRQLVVVSGLSVFSIFLALFATSNSLPNFFNVVASYNLLWLWPIGAFTGYTILIGFVRSIPVERHSRTLSICFVSITVLFSALTIPTHRDKVHTGNAETFKVQAPLLTQVLRELDSFSPRGTVVVDTSNEPFNCPYYSAIMAYLQRRGIDFNVPNTKAGTLAQMGPARAVIGDEVATIRVYVGRSAIKRRDDAATIAFASPLTPVEETELHKLESVLAKSVRNNQIYLIDDVRQLVNDGKSSFSLTDFADALLYPMRFIRDGFGIKLFQLNFLMLNDLDHELFRQLNALHSKIMNTAVTVQIELH